MTTPPASASPAFQLERLASERTYRPSANVRTAEAAAACHSVSARCAYTRMFVSTAINRELRSDPHLVHSPNRERFPSRRRVPRP